MLASGIAVEKEKAAALSKIATAAYFPHLSADVKARILEQEAEIALLENSIRIAELKKKYTGP